MYIALCDDNVGFMEYEDKVIKSISIQLNINIKTDMYTSAAQIISLSDNINKYDLILLDVEMKEKTGVEALKTIRQYSDIPVAFVSSYIDYALDGYKVNAFRYILKRKEAFSTSLCECISALIKSNSYIKSVNLLCREGEISLSEKNIIYVESRLHYIYIHITESKNVKIYSIRMTLDDFEKVVEISSLIRIHKSMLVNAKYIDSIHKYEVLLTNNESFPISRNRYNEVITKNIKYRGKIL